MSNKPAVLRQLNIKSGISKRVLKEHILYAKEAEEQQRKLDKLIANNAEEWDVKSARRILEESHRMIKDSDNRLGKAVQDLRELVVRISVVFYLCFAPPPDVRVFWKLRAKSQPEFAEDVELLHAEEALEEASV
ncbi:tubulin binding cofactor A-domain-containing protein [Suillus subalutaceus]|uniref:tubulin binding cofactor A-domain-containing protein n=1 Tax=Suillus subalutaceus TaxID=48586 RepID=UPI001B8646A8|nr:tubulin binding cofactor A-domain-containing protein [Suillus subalutaceus]KAG1850578.1 tubulin binding cofactor A-domain-containing protein [Suillus subalutaceus]